MKQQSPDVPGPRTVRAISYLTPLREGGSLPAIVEADDGELYVMKFVGGGHGAKSLIAELLGGELARALGLAVPEIVFVELDPVLGRSEGDPEIQQLIQASAGLNLALRFLPKAFAFSPILKPPPEPAVASAIVWFDAFVTNVDRTARNVNLLLWRDRLWLIDHGSAFYFHHLPLDYEGYVARGGASFPMIRDHVLLPFADNLTAAHELATARLSANLFDLLVSWLPAAWLADGKLFSGIDEHRAAYAGFLRSRLEFSAHLVEEAQRVRSQLL